MRILAIETSCDDTGVAILEIDGINQPKLLADLVSSQVKIHAPWGGVVPMLAKREHQKNIVPLFKKALSESGLLKIKSLKLKVKSYSTKLKNINSILSHEPELLKQIIPFFKKYQKPDIDLIAVTIGPGLEPALWVGVNFARALSYFWNLPIIPVNHVEAHICANWPTPVSANSKFEIPFGPSHSVPSSRPRGSGRGLNSKFLFPAVCLVVSGGHTQLILIKKFGEYKILGETRDDAAGEAFDKVAKMLNLGYPGGPTIAKQASQWNFQIRNLKETNSKFEILNSKFKIKLPRPMINSTDFDFSFSGLKTAALYLVKKLTPRQIKMLTPAICAEFQQAVIDVLVSKTIRAARKFGAKIVMLSGGVAANELLRDTLKLETEKLKIAKNGPEFLVPPKNLCTDNAAMVAFAAYLKTQNKKNINRGAWRTLKARANLRIA